MHRISPSIIVLAAFCAAFLIGFWTFTRPTLEEFGRQQAVVQANETIHAGSKAETVKANVLDAGLQSQVMGLLPDGDAHLDLTVQLDALTRSLGLPGGSFTVSAAPAAAVLGVPAKLPMTLAVTGSEQSIQAAIAGLTGLGRYIQVDQVAVSRPVGSQALSAQISASAYYLPSASQ